MKSNVVPSDSVKRVVRVAVSNNFNCSTAEFKQLDKFYRDNPTHFFFVNTNINTPNLLNLNKHPYQSVITANPYLVVNMDLVERIHKVDRVAFARVKWMPEHKDIDTLIQYLNSFGYNVVVTLQRFQSLAMMEKYSTREYYTHSYSRFRLNEKSMSILDKLISRYPHTFICDKLNVGCRGCGLCSKLTYGKILPLSTLNLSSSGLCKNNCPDCYAKIMQNFRIKCGYVPIHFDWIHENDKQKGSTKHIKHANLEVANV